MNDINLLRQMQKLPLEVKILKSQQRIKEWYEKYNGDVYISFSGGKDSTVLYYITKQLYSNIKVVFCDTGLEYPEIKNFVKEFNTIEWLKPKIPFYKVIEKYGYPVISKEQAQYIRQYKRANSEKTKQTRLYGNKWGRGKISKKWQYLIHEDVKISDECCDKIKKEPFYIFEKETSLKPIIGNTTDESNKRTQEWLRFGCNAFETKRPISRPLSFWTEQDILKYLYMNDLQIAKCYGNIINENGIYKTTGIKRTGCMFCAFGVHLEKGKNKFQKMKETHPKQYDYCINKLGFNKVLDLINVKY